MKNGKSEVFSYSKFSKLKVAFGAAAMVAVGGLASSVQAAGSAPFTGVYAGAEVGYNHQSSIFLAPPATGYSGVYYGGFAGARKQFSNNLVIGGEFFVGDSSADRSTGGSGSVFTISAERALGFDGLLGVAVSDNTLLFATVGYLNSKFTTVLSSITTSTTTFTQNDVSFGGGVEVKLTKAISVRLKTTYAKTNFSKVLNSTVGVQVNF